MISLSSETKNTSINNGKVKIVKKNINIKDYSYQIVSFEKILPNHVPEERKLIEITNSSIVARISQSIPNATEVLSKTITNNSIKNVEMYKVLLPSGTQLVKSRAIEGASRGIFRGKNGIKGHANFIKFDPNNISKASALANVAANIVNVGSLVVGQYYMSEINSKLENLSREAKKISDFQEREFKSRILSLVTRVQKISSNNYEILENDELRLQALQTLDYLEGEGSQLLQQVNLAIDELIENNREVNFNEYQILIKDFEIQTEYQYVLVSILNEISRLIYLFGRGAITINLCYSLFNKYYNQSIEVRSNLCGWHNQQLELLEIDVKNNRIKRKGIDKALAYIPAIIDEKWKYKTLHENFGDRITFLINRDLKTNSQVDIYEKDVQIVLKDGKYYYLNEDSKN